jgi:DNA-binding NarL/FixJ family response regulator
MQGQARVTVVILYTHALLGEGLAKLLAAEPGLEITAVATHEIAQAETALSGGPDVVIFERNDPLGAIDLLKFAPDALLIDVGMDAGPTFSYQREEISPKPDGIVRAIRHMKRVRGPAVVGALTLLAAAIAPGTPGLG